MEQNLQALGLKVLSELRATIFPSLRLDPKLKEATLNLFLAVESDLNVGNYEPSSEVEIAYSHFLKQFARPDSEDDDDNAPNMAKPESPSADELFGDERP